jgi:hypothetical protein
MLANIGLEPTAKCAPRLNPHRSADVRVMSKHTHLLGRIVRGLTVGLVLALIAACTTHVSLTQAGHAVVQDEPTQGAVHPYPHVTPVKEQGPFLMVFLATDADLASLAEEHTDHLYYDLLPCSQKSRGFHLTSGTVFSATDNERHRVLDSLGTRRHNLYKVYIPLDLQRIVRQASVQGALDVPNYLKIAEHDGLCMRLGGAHMLGTSLTSNLVVAPVIILNNALVVKGPPS